MICNVVRQTPSAQMSYSNPLVSVPITLWRLECIKDSVRTFPVPLLKRYINPYYRKYEETLQTGVNFCKYINSLFWGKRQKKGKLRFTFTKIDSTTGRSGIKFHLRTCACTFLWCCMSLARLAYCLWQYSHWCGIVVTLPTVCEYDGFITPVACWKWKIYHV